MKELQNNFTTPEQSKRLLELGVPANSADMFLTASDEKYPSTELVWNLYIRKSDSLDKNFFKIYNMNEFQVIPCWSVGRLMEIYDICRCYDGDWDEVYGKETYIETYVSAIEEAVLDDMLDFSKLED